MYWLPAASKPMVAPSWRSAWGSHALSDTTIPSSNVTVPVPEESLTPEEVVARARGLRDALLEGQAATEERTFYSEEMHEEFLRAGFYRILQPRRFGGYEFDPSTFYKVIMEVSRGCPSTGWCLSLAAAHSLQVGALYGERAQAEIFGPDGDFRCAARDTPRGTARPVDGGYIVNGTWDYCSGIPYSTHFMAGAKLDDGNGEDIEYDQFSGRVVLVTMPRSQWEIIHDWGDMLGLRGSGSHSVRVEDAFVPEHLVHDVNLLDVDVSAGTPGSRIHANPMYNGRQVGFFGGELASIAVGTARAMLDEYERAIRRKKTLFSPHVLRSEHHDFQRTLGQATGMVDGAEAIIVRIGQLYMEYCEQVTAGTGEFTIEMDYRLDQMAIQAGFLAWNAADVLVRTGGSSPMHNTARMQRYLRDLTMYRTHMAASAWEEMATTAARFHLQADGPAHSA
jgi:3-hydroxy-9,10-secoandrosta-1,3,5(10)-triene-9,17-dione monooxygenase